MMITIAGIFALLGLIGWLIYEIALSRVLVLGKIFHEEPKWKRGKVYRGCIFCFSKKVVPEFVLLDNCCFMEDL